MWKEQVLPHLMKLCTGKVIVCRTLKTVGLSEAGVDEMVSPLLSSSPVEIGIYAKSDGIHLQLVAKDPEREGAEQKIRDAEVSLRGVLKEHIWGIDDDTLMGIVGKLLIDRGQSLATMESYTGGLLAALFGEVSESSRYYKGGFVIGSRETESAFLDQGAEGKKSGPEELSLAMAATARKKLGADIGIAIAESGDADENEAVVSIAVEDGQKKRTSQRKWPTSRRSVRPWIAVAGLVELRQFLL
jgi:nicotinamide-nucleotide amidase